MSDQWLRFRDAHGVGSAQPDAYAVLPDRVVLIEVKLTQVEEGLNQINYLYGPLLERLYARPVIGCMVFKYIQNKVPLVDLEELFETSDFSPRQTLMAAT